MGASDNRVMLSFQPATQMVVGGTLEIIAPYRFLFSRECEAAGTTYGWS